MTGAADGMVMTQGSTGEVRESLSFVDIIGLLLDGKWTVVMSVVGAIVIGIAYTSVTPPIYSADALIQVEEKSTGLGDLDINELFEGDASIYAEIEILRSRLVLSEVVQNLKLDVRVEPELTPVIGPALHRAKSSSDRLSMTVESIEVPPNLINRQLTVLTKDAGRFELFSPDGEMILGGSVGEYAAGTSGGEQVGIFLSAFNAPAGHVFYLEKMANLQAIETLNDGLGITERGKNSGMLSLSMSGGSPDSVAEILNEIANVYVKKNVERRSAEAEKTLAFLDEQLPAVKQDMETAEVALNTYRLERGSVDLPLETQAILESIVESEAQLNELKRERERVMQSFTAVHPMIVALDRQIQRFDNELSELNSQVRELPNTQQEVLRLVRDTQVNTELYTSLLNTTQELRVVKAGAVGNVRVVDFAVPPYKAVWPRKGFVLALAALLGLFAGISIILLRRSFNNGIVDPDVIEKHMAIPVYSIIPHSRRQDKLQSKAAGQNASSTILAIDSPDDVAIESLRNLRTALHFGMMDASNNCIMIAGPSPAVGKSFVSINLAAVLAGSGKNVLLIDGDMRRGHLHEYLGMGRSNGLSDYVSGEDAVSDCMHSTQLENLTFVPTGRIPPNPSEMLLHQRFSHLIEELSARFDNVIIDSPPVLAVTDATIIGQTAGMTLLVAKSGEHSVRELELCKKRLQQASVNLRGVIVNDMSVEASKYGAGKYSYQYQYKS